MPTVIAQWGAFVHPALAGAALATGLIPVLVHLINRRRHRRVPWAAMAFLLAARRKSRSRLFLEQWLLLALRVAAIVLLGLALARPYFPASGLAVLGTSRCHRILVVDNSFSMNAPGSGKESRLTAAKRAAQELLGSFQALDGGRAGVSIVTLAQPAEAPIGHAAYDRRIIRTQLAAIEPTYQATDLEGGLARVIDIIRQSPMAQGNRAVYLITDLAQRDWLTFGKEGGPGPAVAQARRIAELADLTVVSVGQGHAPNAAITSLAAESPLVGVAIPSRFQVQVTNYGPSVLRSAHLRILRGEQMVRRLPLPTVEPGGAAAMQFSLLFASAGTYRIAARLESAGDDALEPDDRRYLSVEVRETIPVLMVDGRPGATLLEGQAGYLATALAPRIASADQTLFSPKVITELELGGEVLQEFDLIALCNVQRLPPEQWRRLEDFVSHGGGLLVFVGDLPVAEDYNRHGFADGDGLLPCRIGPGVGPVVALDDDRGWGTTLRLDEVVHPLMREFAEAPDSGLFLARITKYVRVDPHPVKAQVVLRYQNNDPALVLRSYDDGRVALLTTSANMEWNNLAAKGDYVPLMLNIAAHLIRRRGEHRTVSVGEKWIEPLSAAQSSLPCEVTTPDDVKHPGRVVSDKDSLSLALSPVTTPGFGSVRIGRCALHFAANVTDEDSDLRAMSARQLETLIEVPIRFVADPADVSTARVGGRSKELAMAGLCVVLVLLFTELLLATQFGRRSEVARRTRDTIA